MLGLGVGLGLGLGLGLGFDLVALLGVDAEALDVRHQLREQRLEQLARALGLLEGRHLPARGEAGDLQLEDLQGYGYG